MKNVSFLTGKTPAELQTAQSWQNFLTEQNFDGDTILNIDLTSEVPVVTDHENRKFSLDFKNDKANYHKRKTSIKGELLSRAVGAGQCGLRLVDLSAGLGIDAVFLSQLGYQIQAVERHPLIYLCLQEAALKSPELNLEIKFMSALDFLKSQGSQHEIFYFDPMFPQKTKSALPRQEMVFFKNLVGSDLDAEEVVQMVLQQKNLKRLAVKRPLAAPFLGRKPNGVLKGKLIRYDIYGENK